MRGCRHSASRSRTRLRFIGVLTVAFHLVISALLPDTGQAQACPSPARTYVSIEVSGLGGGHSGIDVSKRGNAIQVLASLLARCPGVKLASLDTPGNAANAIPSGASVRLMARSEDVTCLSRERKRLLDSFTANNMYHGLAIELQTAAGSVAPLDSLSSARTIALLCGLPQGVRFVDSLGVKTSANLAKVDLGHDSSELTVSLLSRSSDEGMLELQIAQIDALARGLGARVLHGQRYPGWASRSNWLQEVARRSYEKLTNQPLRLASIHAGAEVGVITNHFPGLQAIVLGADIEGQHGVNERLRMESLDILYGVTASLVQRGRSITTRQHAKRGGVQAGNLFLNELCRIPRASDLPMPMVEWLTRFASRRGLIASTDSAGNVLIKAPATMAQSGLPIVLQAHYDMVVEGDLQVKAKVRSEGVTPQVKGGWAFAAGSSLGADNGAGLAVALTIMGDTSLKRGPVWLLATSREEDGMIGALALEHDLTGVDGLINLDGASSKEAVVATSGAVIHIIKMDVTRQSH
jgi:di/tripeptidase